MNATSSTRTDVGVRNARAAVAAPASVTHAADNPGLVATESSAEAGTAWRSRSASSWEFLLLDGVDGLEVQSGGVAIGDVLGDARPAGAAVGVHHYPDVVRGLDDVSAVADDKGGERVAAAASHPPRAFGSRLPEREALVLASAMGDPVGAFFFEKFEGFRAVCGGQDIVIQALEELGQAFAGSGLIFD